MIYQGKTYELQVVHEDYLPSCTMCAFGGEGQFGCGFPDRRSPDFEACTYGSNLDKVWREISQE